MFEISRFTPYYGQSSKMPKKTLQSAKITTLSNLLFRCA